MTSLTIIGRRWFNNTQGNTYFSAIALIDGKQAASIDYEYGYSSQYEWSMFNKLEELGLLPNQREAFKNGSKESPWTYCERNGIEYSAIVSDVRRKKDL